MNVRMQDIREITGYLLVVSVNADVIPLTSLIVIRGRTLFEHGAHHYSVFITNNFHPNNERNVGLRELQLPSLHGRSFVNIFIP